MIYKQLAPIRGQVRVTFELPACVWADRISVVGDFNGWRPTETPLQQDRAGAWRAVVDLPAGRQFEFCYLVDGKWRTDHNADGSRPNEFGSENCLVDTSLDNVEAPRAEVRGAPLVRTSLPRLAARAHMQPLRLPARTDVAQRAS